MADVLTKAQRSFVMSRIRGKDTKPELLVRRYLFSRGLRYRKHDRRFPGRPDLYFAKWRAVVFVNGCFWHAHKGCPGFRVPKSRKAYWRKKLNGNRRRDKANHAKLAAMGLRVLVVWECELKSAVREERLERLYKEITGGDERGTGHER